MYVTHLTLANFRNYLALELALPPGLVLLQGENAQGKTNFLEALYFLATSRSPRTARDGELIAWNIPENEASATRLHVRIRRAADEATLEVFVMARPDRAGRARNALDQEEDSWVSAAAGVQKRIRVNGIPRRGLDLLGTLRVVLFRPEDIELITGPPAGRRRAVDIFLSQTDPRYPQALQRYARVLLQRNHLLRRIAERPATPEELTPWDESLVKEGAYLLAQRLRSLDRLSELAAACHGPLTGGQEKLAISYLGTVPLGDRPSTYDAGVLATRFRERLQAVRRRDIALGQTTIGPHRDDLVLRVNGALASTYGSRGQQRTAALAWKLAEARYLREATGDDPVVLMDDVLSELDAARRRSVLETLEDYQQVFLTTTGVELTGGPLPAAARFLVRQGRITPDPNAHPSTSSG